MEKSCAGFVW